MQKHLTSATSYETDDSSGRMTDSLFYQYDSYGNRIKETKNDNECALVYDIEYKWYDTESVPVLTSISSRTTIQKVSFREKHLCFDSPITGL